MRKKSISSKGNIPLLLYKKILGLMPIPCVDLVFKSGNDVYLFKRSYEPAKNEWWLVGGRINRWETFEEAAVRKAKEEIGVDVKIIKIIGVYEIFFPVNRFDAKSIKTRQKGTHTIAIDFLVEPKHKDFKLSLNEEYKGYKIVKKIDDSLHPYVKKVLKDARLSLQ